MKRISLLTLLSLFGTFAFGQVQVDYITPELAVEQLLGDGINVFNVEFTGSSVQLGLLYEANDIVFTPDSGIIMSCADVRNPATGGGDDVPFDQGVSGEPDLLTIANSVPPLIGESFSVISVNDIAILEFDFVPTGTNLSFNYSFGSDEYLAWVNSQYNDIFAFFLSGPGIVGPYDSPIDFPDGAINIAYVPDSDPELPITISSVNDLINTQYYIDNPSNDGIAMNGFTSQFTASAEVQCGELYHIKLAIADGSDTGLDSFVTLEAGSFASTSVLETFVPEAPEGLSESTLVEGCLDGILTFKRNCTETELAILTLEIGGDATPGADYEPIQTDVTFPAGVFEVEIPIITNIDNDVEDTEEIIISTINEETGDTTTVSFFIFDYQDPYFEQEYDIFLCDGANQLIAPEIIGGFPDFTITWSTDESGESIIATSESPTDIYFSGIDFCGSQFNDSIRISVPTPLILDDNYDNFCTGIFTTPIAEGGAQPYAFSYSLDSLEYSVGAFSPIYPGLYEIQIVDQCGESGTVFIDAIVCETVFPNIFSPNDDSKNDTFIISGLQGFPNSDLYVYNRWGGLVFEGIDYQNSWRAEDLPDGVYYYVLNRSDGETFNGEITIVRN